MPDRSARSCGRSKVQAGTLRRSRSVVSHTSKRSVYPPALHGMIALAAWIEKTNVGKRAMFISDNNGFDWQFVNYYFHRFTGRNPFGHSSTNLGSLYKGLVKDTTKNFKHLRRTKHTHDPVDDARGNVEALLHMRRRWDWSFRCEAAGQRSPAWRADRYCSCTRSAEDERRSLEAHRPNPRCNRQNGNHVPLHARATVPAVVLVRRPVPIGRLRPLRDLRLEGAATGSSGSQRRRRREAASIVQSARARSRRRQQYPGLVAQCEGERRGSQSPR